MTVLVKVKMPSTEIGRTEMPEDFCGTSMFKYRGKGKRRLPWETGEGLLEKLKFRERPNLLFPSPPFWRQCFPTFGGLGTLGNYFPSPSISVKSRSWRLKKSRQNPTKGLFGFILLFCFWNPRCLGFTCQYLHLPCTDIANRLWNPFPLVPESFFPPFLIVIQYM